MNTTSKYKKELLDRVQGMTTDEIMESLSNEERCNLLGELLENESEGYYEGPAVCFVYRSGNVFIAVDNRTHDCWVEEFKTDTEALKWAVDSEGDPS